LPFNIYLEDIENPLYYILIVYYKDCLVTCELQVISSLYIDNFGWYKVDS